MSRSPALIESELEQTRVALAEKLSALEEKISNPVETATQTVQETLSLKDKVREHPLLTVGVAALVGFVGDRVLGPSPSSREQPKPSPSTDPQRDSQEEVGWLDHLGDILMPEGSQLKSLAIGTSMGVLRDLLANSLSGQLRDEAENVINRLTEKVGGKPIQSPLVNGSSNGSSDNQEVSRQDGTTEKWEGRWDQLKGKAKNLWGDLSDDRLAAAEGDYQRFVGTIKEETGESIEEIERKLNGALIG